MKKISFTFFFVLLLLCSANAQQKFMPTKYYLEGKDYFVYPVRVDWSQDEIPPTGFSIPDGDYILFHSYTFKRNRLKKRMDLRDTCMIAAIFSIKNNLPEGKAEFFQHNCKGYGETRKIKKKINKTTTGAFKNGLKDGAWEIIGEYSRTVRNYKEGVLMGYSYFYNHKNNLIEKSKYFNGEMIDTFFTYYSNGNPKKIYDVINKEKDTVFVRENFVDQLLQDRSVRFYDDVWPKNVKSFLKSYNPEGKIINDVRFTNGKNPVFDTLWLNRAYSLKKNKTNWLVVKKIKDDSVKPIYVVSKIVYYNDSKKISQSYFEGSRLFKEVVITKYSGWKYIDTAISETIDYQKLDFTSWRDTIVATRQSGRLKTYFHFIPAIAYCWEENSSGKTHHKPLEVDSIEKKISTRDTLNSYWSTVAIAREVRLWQQDRKDLQWERDGTRKKFGFLSGVRDIQTDYYFVSNVYHDARNTFSDITDKFVGSVWSEQFVENGKPLNGKTTFVNEEKIIKRNHFKIKPKYFTEGTGNVESGYFVDGVKNGRWERLSLERTRKIGDNLEAAFKRKPRDSEAYLVADFKDGEAEGIVRNYQTVNREEYIDKNNSGRFKVVEKLYTYMDYEANYTEGYLNGPYKSFYYNSKPQFTANLLMGRLDGRCEFFSEDGQIEKFSTFKNDTLHGAYGEFVGGKKNVEAFFENNMLQGKYSVYSTKNEKLLLEINADKNILLSKVLFFDNGEVKEQMQFLPDSKIEFGRDMAGFDNFLEQRKRKFHIDGEDGMSASYKTFYENRKILSEGKVIKGNPEGQWKFYNVAGTMINEVLFKEMNLLLAEDKDSTKFLGTITGYFNNGKIRCKGYVIDWESGYDCSTHQDKTKFEVLFTDNWTYEGESILKNGNGRGTFFDENGNKIADGAIKNLKKEGVWKYFDPDQKLNETGKYVNGQKDGLWYSGDLENMNFEDAACFDGNDKDAQKKFEYNKKELKFTTRLYKNGDLIQTETFQTDLNKTREYRKKSQRYGSEIVDF